MFGFLKKKIEGFGEKLKEKVIKKPETEQIIKDTKPIQETKVEEKKQEPLKIIEKQPIVIEDKTNFENTLAQKDKKIEEKPKEVKEKKEILVETKKEQPKQKVEEKTESSNKETEKKEKKGFLEKLFRKKEESIIKQEKEIVEEKPSKQEEIIEKQVLEEKEPLIKKELEDFEQQLEEREELKSDLISSELPEENLSDAAIETKEIIEEKNRDIKIKTLDEEKRQLKASVGKGGKLKGFLFGNIEINEKDVDDLLWELELSLLESDVEQDTAHELVTKIKEKIVGQKVSIKNIDEFLKTQIKEILTEMMTTEKIDLIQEIKNCNGPYKILMLGPNGAGKTTHIAKLSKHFMDNGLKVIWAAGDTFRAAAIDQLEVHAERLGVRVVKHQYNADPAAVAFDAVKAAEANKIDVVLIDSAGRQETNKNLMEELKKIERVVKPNMKIYVGEAYAGQSLLEQATEFDEAIGITGFILSKIDTDAKGGTTISLLYKLKKPILYVGTGQEYDDFAEFTPEFILNRII